jgi:hypothetical protein
VDSDYRFGNFLQLSAFGSKDKASLTDSFRSVGAFAGIVPQMTDAHLFSSGQTGKVDWPSSNHI